MVPLCANITGSIASNGREAGDSAMARDWVVLMQEVGPYLVPFRKVLVTAQIVLIRLMSPGHCALIVGCTTV